MSRRRTRALTIFTLVALSAFASGAAVVVAGQIKPAARSSRASAPARTLSLSCPSPSLGGSLPTLVYLPAGYSRHSRRYPVIYFLHGLPANPTSYEYNGFVAAAAAGGGLRAIVVTPQGARSPNSDREYLDWSPTEDWPQAIAHDLTSCIDHRFHTIGNRFGRALIGLSAGGYGAFNIGLRNLQTFAAVQSWSGYFVATDPSGEQILDLGSTEANDGATVPFGVALTQELHTWPSMLAFYVGSQDTRFLTMNQRFAADLNQGGIAHTFRVYTGGHTSALWHGEATHWLSLALGYMAREARRRGRSPGSGLPSTDGGVALGSR